MELAGAIGMSEKMTDRTRGLVINIAMMLGLTWCYFKGYPPKIILGSGVFLFAFANALLYFRRKHSSTQL